MRPLLNQPGQIIGRNPQVAGDAVEVGTVHLADLVELAPVMQPVAKGIDQILDGGICVLGGHGTPPIVTIGPGDANVVAPDQTGAFGAPAFSPLVEEGGADEVRDG